jgi:hypothetical protein
VTALAARDRIAPAVLPRHTPARVVHALAAWSERLLTRELALVPRAVPEGLDCMSAEWKGERLTLVARAYEGEDVAYARVVTLRGGGVAIGNVLCVPRARRALPILGADLVVLGGRGASMIVADLSPTLPTGDRRDAQLATVDGLVRPRVGEHRPPPGGALPHWCARFFSPSALFARPVTERDLAAAARAYRRFPRALVRLARTAGAPAGDAAAHARAVYAAYASAHRTDDRGLGMLARVFGGGRVERFVAEVLFPESLEV